MQDILYFPAMINRMGFDVSARLVKISEQVIVPVTLRVAEGRIVAIQELVPAAEQDGWPFLMPGFTDAHVHIESSLLIPSEFARLAVIHGTVATVSDPHEIANVCGIEGVNYMMEEGRRVPFKFYFGAPSCVPATTFETAGATLDVAAVSALLDLPEVKYLSEMMNFPGVLYNDPEVMEKIAAALQRNKPVDGHAPGLRGEALQTYINAGISTDHECFTKEEALDKLQRGMKVLIREGSAAKNFDALIPLMQDWHEHMMFCSDDKHPDSLLEGHINQLCARAIDAGIGLFKVLQAACINPVRHYGLEVGLLQPFDPADFILVEDLKDFKVLATYINGHKVADAGKTLILPDPATALQPINQFTIGAVTSGAFQMADPGTETVSVIEALDGQLITGHLHLSPARKEGWLIADTGNDILKMAVINRYSKAPVALALIRNFGLKKGALASSVAHDSHNIVVVGCTDADMARAANLVIAEKGGLAATDGTTDQVLGLPVAGLMSNGDGFAIGEQYAKLDAFSKSVLGSRLKSPFMTLSFMALLVIPHLKLSDKGLFDGDKFALV